MEGGPKQRGSTARVPEAHNDSRKSRTAHSVGGGSDKAKPAQQNFEAHPGASPTAKAQLLLQHAGTEFGFRLERLERLKTVAAEEALGGKGSSGPAGSGLSPEDALQIETLEEQLASLKEDECNSVFAVARREKDLQDLQTEYSNMLLNSDLPTWVDIEMTTEEKLAVIAAETETVHFSIAIRKWIFRRLENEGFEESKLAAHYQGEIDKVDRRLAHAEDQLRESFELEQLVLAKAVEIEMQLEDQRDKCRRLLATRNGTAAQSREELEAVQRLVAELGTRKSPLSEESHRRRFTKSQTVKPDEPPEPEDPLEELYRAANVTNATEFLDAWRGQRERFQTTFARLAENEALWEAQKAEFAQLRTEVMGLQCESFKSDVHTPEADDLRVRVKDAVKRLERSAMVAFQAEADVASMETCLRTLIRKWVSAGFGPDDKQMAQEWRQQAVAAAKAAETRQAPHRQLARNISNARQRAAAAALAGDGEAPAAPFARRSGVAAALGGRGARPLRKEFRSSFAGAPQAEAQGSATGDAAAASGSGSGGALPPVSPPPAAGSSSDRLRWMADAGSAQQSAEPAGPGPGSSAVHKIPPRAPPSIPLPSKDGQGFRRKALSGTSPPRAFSGSGTGSDLPRSTSSPPRAASPATANQPALRSPGQVFGRAKSATPPGSRGSGGGSAAASAALAAASGGAAAGAGDAAAKAVAALPVQAVRPRIGGAAVAFAGAAGAGSSDADGKAAGEHALPGARPLVTVKTTSALEDIVGEIEAAVERFSHGIRNVIPEERVFMSRGQSSQSSAKPPGSADTSGEPTNRQSFSLGHHMQLNAFRAAARGVSLAVPKVKAAAAADEQEQKKKRLTVMALKERLAREKEEREKAEARAHVLAFSGREASRQNTFAQEGDGALDEQEEFEESRAVALLKRALTKGGKAPRLTEVVISRQTLKEISGSLGAARNAPPAKVRGSRHVRNR